jgi:hypothetical protein
MELSHAVDGLKRELATLADAGGGKEARAVLERLAGSLDSAIRMTLLEALSAATAEISRELAPVSVELRLRGRDPEFVVTPPPAAPSGAVPPPVPEVEPEPFVADDGPVARINVRMPEQLKAAVEEAAAREGRSVNAWLIRAASAAVQPRPGPRSPQNQKRFTGWVR